MRIDDFRQELLRSSVCIQDLFRKLITPVCQRFDFTLQQLFILGSLYQKNNQTPRELSSQIGISPNNFSAVSKKLEKRGLVQKNRSTADKRMSIIHLTESGRDLLQEMEQEMAGQYGELFGQVPEEIFYRIIDGFEALNELSRRV
ncbi:MAG: MarR family transcriptional regulator [Candidatus Heteroscillospira sp.]|jgi:DNA-binding MarR family transcriptional regulator